MWTILLIPPSHDLKFNKGLCIVFAWTAAGRIRSFRSPSPDRPHLVCQITECSPAQGIDSNPFFFPCLSFHPFFPPRIQSSHIQSVSHVCPFTQIPPRCTVMWRSTWLQKPWSLARPDQHSFSWKISVTGGPQRAPLQILRVTSLSNRSLE